MNEFNQMWDDIPSPDAAAAAEEPIAKHEDTDEYQLKQGLADTSLLIDFLSVYYFAKHGQIQDPLFEPECDDIEFVLK